MLKLTLIAAAAALLASSAFAAPALDKAGKLGGAGAVDLVPPWMIRAPSAAARISRGAARYARTGCAATAWCFARGPDRAALGPATREAWERAKTRRQPVWARSSIAGTARSVVPTLTVNSVINCSAHRERSFGNTTANDANALRAVSRVTTR